MKLDLYLLSVGPSIKLPTGKHIYWWISYPHISCNGQKLDNGLLLFLNHGFVNDLTIDTIDLAGKAVNKTSVIVNRHAVIELRGFVTFYTI